MSVFSDTDRKFQTEPLPLKWQSESWKVPDTGTENIDSIPLELSAELLRLFYSKASSSSPVPGSTWVGWKAAETKACPVSGSVREVRMRV